MKKYIILILAIISMIYVFTSVKAEDTIIKKGDVIGQAIFQKYLIVDNDNAEGDRIGGFGSTSK